MKRFYCTICKKVKRVRQYPASVDSPTATLPTDRIGECNSHYENSSRAARMERRTARKLVGAR